MASIDGQYLREFTMIWIIENFSYSWHKKGEAIVSPLFRVHTFQSTEWRLSIFPKGKEKRDYITCLLGRNCNGPPEIQLNVEISFLGKEGSALAKAASNNQSFKQNTLKFFSYFVKQEEVFAEKRAEFLPEDILTVRCRLWTNDTDVIKPEQGLARTWLEVYRKWISGTVNGFSSLQTDEVRSLHITSASEETNQFRMYLQLTDGINCDENLNLQIAFPENQLKILSTCKVYLLDEEQNKLECGKSEIDLEKAHDWNFLLVPTKWKLTAKKSLYLPNDILTLECEIIISTRVLSSTEFERTEVAILSELIPISNRDRFEDSAISSSALKDLVNLYNDQVLCDVTLKTNTEAFPAHTVILSARSSVFRAMFTSDMNEKNSACVDISDFDSETIRRLLLYAYTDTTEDLEWDIASQLYAAADKYDIISLKKKCSAYLKESLCTSKACELLVLADLYQDIDIKNFVHNYISQNYDKILGSSEWKDLEQKNPQLLIETLIQMFTNVKAF